MIVYYFFVDLYPPLHNNRRPFDPPTWFVRLFERLPPSAGTETETDAAEIRNDFAAAAAPEVR